MINFSESRGREGYFTIRVWRKGKLIREDTVKNIITDAALDKEIGIYAGTAPDIQIQYCALGTDNTTPTASDTALGSESDRFPITTPTATGGTGIMTTGFYITASDLVGVTIEEIGIFCGSGATAAADSGTLLSRILWNFSKTINDEIEILRTDTVARA